ncbi:MAG: hypothetical protein IRY99_07010 [Isosphaeraceae bacterium]|nr:hypothetical protein [Isosphaeraceae bacterium]
MLGKLSWLSLALILVLAAAVWADPPQINGTTPLGAQRGVTTEVTINGANLAGNPQLVAPFALVAEPLPGSDAANGKFRVTAVPETAVGIYPIRIKTDDGISNPILFAVGQVPQVAEKEDNSTFEQAQMVPSPVVIEGQAAGNDVDFFRFPGKKGQRIVVDAQCARIGSGVDPTIRLTTAARRFITSADDTPGLLTDARLTTVLPEDTDYVIEISDTRYQGGNRPIYRLVVGALPVAEEVYPLGGRRGETVGFELRGGTLPEPQPRLAAATVNAPADEDSFRLQVTTPALGLAGPTDPALELETTHPLEVSDFPELREPADPKAPPLRVAAPVVINGRIEAPGDEDRFLLHVTPGQVLSLRVRAADLGSALDGVLQVLGAKDAVLAQADDTTIPVATKVAQKKAQATISPDPSLRFTVPSGVTEITLALRDLEGRGGTGFPYRLIVEPVTPSFHVTLDEAQVSIPRGGTAAVGVKIARNGYNGPITLTVLDPPSGLSVRPGTVAEGQSVGVLSLSAASDAAFGPVCLRVVGQAQGPNGPILEIASKEVIYATQANLPTNSQTQRGLVAAPALPRLVTLEVPVDEPIEVVHGFGASIPIKVNRSAGGEGSLAISPLPLPPGLTIPNAQIDDKAEEGTITVNAAPEAALGNVTIGLTAKGKIGGKDQTLVTPAITLHVVRPAAVELAASAIEVKAGQTAEVKGKLLRKGPFQEPVTIKLNGLPAGTKAEPVTVAPDASEFALKIVADAGAAAAQASAQVVLAFQINKKDYATPPTPITVKVNK